MTDTSLDDLGPVDYLVVEFPAGASNYGAAHTEVNNPKREGAECARRRAPGFGRPASSGGYGWLARIECTSAPSVIVDVKKLITLLPVIVSSPM
jgi:hypothetical protein